MKQERHSLLEDLEMGSYISEPNYFGDLKMINSFWLKYEFWTISGQFLDNFFIKYVNLQPRFANF